MTQTRLDALIEAVQHEVPEPDGLHRLSAAATTAAELVEVADDILDHFVDECRRDGYSWREISEALGVTKQAAHKRYTLPIPAKDRFTIDAQIAIGDADHEAQGLGHNYIGTEHLLLGLLEPSPGSSTAAIPDSVQRPRAANRNAR